MAAVLTKSGGVPLTAWTPKSTAVREDREPWKAPMGVRATAAM
jgi:hypothetical protein